LSIFQALSGFWIRFRIKEIRKLVPTCRELGKLVPMHKELKKLMPMCKELEKLVPMHREIRKLMAMCRELRKVVPTCRDPRRSPVKSFSKS
jgi:hypothetical protein